MPHPIVLKPNFPQTAILLPALVLATAFHYLSHAGFLVFVGLVGLSTVVSLVQFWLRKGHRLVLGPEFLEYGGTKIARETIQKYYTSSMGGTSLVLVLETKEKTHRIRLSDYYLSGETLESVVGK